MITAERCDGCDAADLALASYVVTNHAGDTSAARYCADCAAHARMGRGEASAIEEVPSISLAELDAAAAAYFAELDAADAADATAAAMFGAREGR